MLFQNQFYTSEFNDASQVERPQRGCDGCDHIKHFEDYGWRCSLTARNAPGVTLPFSPLAHPYKTGCDLRAVDRQPSIEAGNSNEYAAPPAGKVNLHQNHEHYLRQLVMGNSPHDTFPYAANEIAQMDWSAEDEVTEAHKEATIAGQTSNAIMQDRLREPAPSKALSTLSDTMPRIQVSGASRGAEHA